MNKEEEMRKKIIVWITTIVTAFSICLGSTAVAFAGNGDSANAGFLSEFSVASSMSATAEKMEISPAFSPDVHEYTVITPDTASSFYIWAKLSEAGDGGAITAKWSWYTTGAAKTAAVTSGNSTGQYLANLQEKGGDTGKTFTLEVTKGNETQEYKFTTKTVRSLTNLTLKANGKAVKLSPAFSKDVKEYTAKVADSVSALTVTPQPFGTENYKIKVDGKSLTGSSAEVQMGDEAQKIVPITVDYANGENITGSYKITVNRISAVKAAFDVTPEDAIVFVKNDQNERMEPDESGNYTLLPGDDYTYSVTKNGYVGQNGILNLQSDETKKINLTKAEENQTIDKTITAEWKNFRGSDANMAITNAKTPQSKETTQFQWAKKLGSGWGAAPSVQIVVDGKVVTMSGNKIYKLNKESGEVEQEGQLVDMIDWGYTPPTYAEGMIFCPLTNGTVQAIDAKTFESLWVYHDPLKGQANTPITYADGYVYTGFWNNETAEANYVCLSAADEDPSSPDEVKTATWTYAAPGGFYWAGSVVVGNAVIFGTDDGTTAANGPTSHLLSLDRLTGKVISDCNLTGDQRSTIAYDQSSGRVFGTTKAGYMFSAAVNSSTGKLSDLKTKWYGDNASAMSTSAPVIYKGVAYIGFSNSGNFGDKNYLLAAKSDTLEELYRVPLKGYPQGSALLSTADEEKTGKIHLYMTYNAQPGGISMVTAPTDATSADQVKVEEIYDAEGYEQYGITSLICDAEGTIYYKNDSCNILAVASNSAYLSDLKISGGNPALDKKFSSSRLTYDVAVDPGTESVTLQLAALDTATVTVNGKALENGSTTVVLDQGKATAVIKVSEGSDSREYTLNLREKSQVTALSKIAVTDGNGYSDGIALTPAFDENGKNYIAYNVTSSRSFENLWPDAKDGNASVKVYAVAGVDEEDLDNPDTKEIEVTSKSGVHSRYAVYFGEGKRTTIVKVVVTAEDGKTTGTYNITMTKNKDDKTLMAELSDSEGFTVDAVKAPCQAIVEAYKAAETYSGTQKDNYDYILSSTKKLIAKADTKEEVAEIVDSAKTQMNKLKSDADIFAQEQKVAAESVDRYLDDAISMSDYRSAQQSEINKAAEAAKIAIEAAKTKADTEKAVNDFKRAVKSVKTDAQLTAEELKTAKEAAEEEIDVYNDNMGQYRISEKVKALMLVIETKGKIDDAESIADVDAVMKSAKADFEKLLTDEDYKTAAMKKAITLKVTAKTYKSAALSWTKNNEAAGYEIYRADKKGASYKKIKTTTATSYTNTSLSTGNTYYYKIRAYAKSGNKTITGVYSSAKAVKPVLSTPSTVKAKAGKRSAIISWKKVSGANGYKVYRATKKSGKYATVKTITKSSTVKFTNKKLKSGKRYYYKMRAYKKVGGKTVYSGYSKVVGAKAK